MKKNQLIKVIITIIVFAITISALYFGTIRNNLETSKENIIKYHKLAMDADIIENYYYTLHNNELNIYDWNNSLILTHKGKDIKDNVRVFKDKYFIINETDKSYLYNIEGKLINTTKAGDIYMKLTKSIL